MKSKVILKYAKRVLAMLIGLFLSALGVSFSIKAGLGTSPIACCPAVYSVPLGVTVGTAMWMMCILFVIMQIIILQKEFQPFQILQMAVVFAFGSFTDLTSTLLVSFPSAVWTLKLLYCALGIVLLAFGIYLLLKRIF